MNTKQQAAEQLINFIAQFQGVLDLAGELKTIGDLEAYEQAVKGRIALHETNEQAAKDRAAKQAEDVQASRGLAGEIRDNAQQDANLLLKDADVKAQAAIASATRQAANIIADAQAQKSAIDAKVSAAADQLVDLQQDILVKQSKVDALRNDMAELAKKLG